jgi:transcriptional antiterminator RfaH
MSDLSIGSVAWYALHTKPNQEKRAFLNLEAWGVETFLPWLRSHERSSGFAPLFPGYIFARFAPPHLLHKICFTRGVSHIVSFGGIPAVIEEDLVAALRSRTDEDGVALIQPGDVVMVRSGPLRNLIGVFEKRLPDSERIEILLTTIAYSARIRISKTQVSKVDE